MLHRLAGWRRWVAQDLGTRSRLEGKGCGHERAGVHGYRPPGAVRAGHAQHDRRRGRVLQAHRCARAGLWWAPAQLVAVAQQWRFLAALLTRPPPASRHHPAPLNLPSQTPIPTITVPLHPSPPLRPRARPRVGLGLRPGPHAGVPLRQARQAAADARGRGEALVGERGWAT
jgi:hypothetical protein